MDETVIRTSELDESFSIDSDSKCRSIEKTEDVSFAVRWDMSRVEGKVDDRLIIRCEVSETDVQYIAIGVVKLIAA